MSAGATLALDRPQGHYLADVLRLRPGGTVLVFNGRDGEWRGLFATGPRRSVLLTIEEQTRPQTPPADLHYLFAPLKRSRLDYMVQKAVELGVSRLQPVLTQHTQAERVNTARMRANVVEAARAVRHFDIAGRRRTRLARRRHRRSRSRAAARLLRRRRAGWPIRLPRFAKRGRVIAPASFRRAVLIGPEGGFSAEERALLLRRGRVVRLALGPRILRADTAAVASLALVQAVLGDWR